MPNAPIVSNSEASDLVNYSFVSKGDTISVAAVANATFAAEAAVDPVILVDTPGYYLVRTDSDTGTIPPDIFVPSQETIDALNSSGVHFEKFRAEGFWAGDGST